VARLALLLLLVTTPLGAAAMEVGTGVSLGLALLFGDRRASPLAGPGLAVACWLLASAVGHGAAGLLEALGRVWPLAPILSVPMLRARLNEGEVEQARRFGLAAAGLVAALALGQAALQLGQSGLLPWERPVSGPFSHHLTLGYALLMPLAAAVQARRPGLTLLLSLGVLSAGSSGPLLSLGVLLLASALPPWPVLAGGLVVAVGFIRHFALGADVALHERALLWATGQTLMLERPLGVGPLGFREAAAALQDTLEPGYFFPLHAHDSLLQLGAIGGFGGLAAWGWLLLTLATRTGRAGKAMLSAILVGGLTQDVLGDLEVVRALLVWTLLDAPALAAAAPLENKSGGAGVSLNEPLPEP
jgi:hypothetical protein